MKPFIIADIGSNYRNSLDLALKQIEAAKECGADATKFQLYTHQELYGLPGKLDYELPIEWLPKLAEHCEKVGIEFMCSAFSPEGVRAVDPFVKRHKLASSEICHYEIIEAIKATGKEWIASTGGAHWSEVKTLINHHTPTGLLECVARYPAPTSDYDLECIPEWANYAKHEIECGKSDYKIAVGISDHTLTDSVALASIGFGATIFEKHFDCVGCNDTPDSPVSLDPLVMSRYCAAIREAFSAIGDGIKQPRHQHDAQLRYRRRLIVTKDLPAFTKLKAHENYGIYRSLVDDTRGDRPENLMRYDGMTLKVDKRAGDSLWRDDVNT